VGVRVNETREQGSAGGDYDFSVRRSQFPFIDLGDDSVNHEN
jgi:hypothetical protein